MLSAFFALAARSPSRQIAFRKVVAVHLVLLAGVFGIMGILVAAARQKCSGIRCW